MHYSRNPENPGKSNVEISKLLGYVWRNLSDEEKKPFIEKSKELQEKHIKDFPDYKYRPKRKKKSSKNNEKLYNADGQRYSNLEETGYLHQQQDMNARWPSVGNDQKPPIRPFSADEESSQVSIGWEGPRPVGSMSNPSPSIWQGPSRNHVSFVAAILFILHVTVAIISSLLSF